MKGRRRIIHIPGGTIFARRDISRRDNARRGRVIRASIRPAFCRHRNAGDRCDPYIHDVMAVREGRVLRVPGQGSFQLLVNAADLRARFRYLHMSPNVLDAHGVFIGRFAREGEILGTLGNFLTPNVVTTAHLHFELQVPTKDGWVLVNPYMTLVASYEHLIEARGREIREGINATLAIESLASRPASLSAGASATDKAKSP
jgi:hypothetical protein